MSSTSEKSWRHSATDPMPLLGPARRNSSVVHSDDNDSGPLAFDYAIDPPGNPAVERLETLLAGERSASAHETALRVLEKAEVLGLTRLTNLAGVDRIRIPNFAAICPSINWPPVPGMISVFSGKGVTDSLARASALMETVERWSAVYRNDFVMRGSYRDLRRRHPVVNPKLLYADFPHNASDDVVLDWVPAKVLVSGESVLVPAWLVYVPYRPSKSGAWIGKGTTNGLAAGNTYSEAELQALYELIERDALATAIERGSVNAFDQRTFPRELSEFVSFAFPDDVVLEVRDITSKAGVISVEAVIRGYDSRMQQQVSVGQGTHMNPAIALLRAITEASQSRVTAMVGIREDMQLRASTAMNCDPRDWFRISGTVRFPTSLAGSVQSTDATIALLLERLKHAGVSCVYRVDLTRPELAIPVVRLLAPQMEVDVVSSERG